MDKKRQQYIKQNKKKEEMQHIHETVKSSSYYIPDLVDADAAKGNNDDDEQYDSDRSISDLSEGFDDDQQPKDSKDDKDDSKRTLFRYKSTRNWNPIKLDEHADDMLTEMRRLSISNPRKRTI